MRFLICTRPRGVFPNTIPIADFCNQVAAELSSRGHEVLLVFVVRPPNKEEEAWLRQAGLKWTVWISGRRPTSLRDLFHLIQIIKGYKPDCVEFHFSSIPWGMIASWLLRIQHRIAWYHTTVKASRHNPIYSRLLVSRAKIYRKLASIHVVNSSAMKEEYIRLFQINPEHIHVQHIGVHLLNFMNEPEQHTREAYPTIACVSSLSTSKGQDVIIKALKYILPSYPDLKVIFAGPGGKGPFVELASELEVSHACCFVGSLSRRDVYQLLSTCTLTVFPTRAEAFGKVALEALACGAPLIASATGGILDIVKDGTNGILVPPGDIDLWADAILRLLDNPALQRTLHENGLARAQDFELEHQATTYADWLLETVRYAQP